jgi:hypothetical protein
MFVSTTPTKQTKLPTRSGRVSELFRGLELRTRTEPQKRLRPFGEIPAGACSAGGAWKPDRGLCRTLGHAFSGQHRPSERVFFLRILRNSPGPAKSGSTWPELPWCQRGRGPLRVRADWRRSPRGGEGRPGWVGGETATPARPLSLTPGLPAIGQHRPSTTIFFLELGGITWRVDQRSLNFSGSRET